jgi:cupin fold WbuC family metalloprotein
MEYDEPVRLALDPPEGLVVSIDESIIRSAIEASRKSPRGRIILPFHLSEQDPLQRMLNVLQPGTYIQPHRHLSPPKSEPIVILRGSLKVFVFDSGGEVKERIKLEEGSSRIGVDIRPGVFHTFAALAADTVVFEVKPGPYETLSDKDFAPWAPKEGTPEASVYLRDLLVESRLNDD